jgi:hypothetical protein
LPRWDVGHSEWSVGFAQEAKEQVIALSTRRRILPRVRFFDYVLNIIVILTSLGNMKIQLIERFFPAASGHLFETKSICLTNSLSAPTKPLLSGI